MLGVSMTEAGEELFMKYTVSNLTFEGLDSPLLHMGDIDDIIGQIVNSRFPYGKFGWLYGVIWGIIVSVI